MSGNRGIYEVGRFPKVVGAGGKRITLGESDNTACYYMASSVSWQDELNPAPSGQDGAILLAQDYPLCPALKNFPQSHRIFILLTKFVQSRWLDVGIVLFL